MGRQKTSVIWKLESEKFKNLVRTSACYGHVLKFFGLKNHGNNCNTLKKRIKEENIDDSHLKNFSSIKPLEDYRQQQTRPLKEILTKNSSVDRRSVKKRLLSNNLIKNQCDMCGLPPTWNKRKLVLVLDHINGINNDFRLKNLRLLCPNCNSQTDTFCGRSKKRIYNCKKCGKEIKGEGKTGLCFSCLRKIQKVYFPPRKFEVSKEDLEKLVWGKPVTKVAIDFKVSGNAIKKRCKFFKIPVPPRGYWTKKFYGKL